MALIEKSVLAGLAGFVVVTGAEVAGLASWLPLTDEGRPFVGLAALLTGEAIEWALLAYLIARSQASAPLRQGRVAQGLVLTGLTSLAEVAMWIGWLYLIAHIGLALATLGLLIAMHLKHGVDVSVFTGRPYVADLIAPSALIATLWEVGGAAIWFGLATSGYGILGVLMLTLCISIEHYLQFKSAGILKVFA